MFLINRLRFFILATLLVSIAIPETMGQASPPSLNTPGEGATDLNANFLIGIGAVSGASSYDIELSDDGSYTGSSPAYQAQLNSTKRVMAVDSLMYGHTYSLRWRSDNSSYGNTTLTVKAEPETWANITNGTTFEDGDVMYPKQQHLTTQFDWEFDTELTFDSPNLVSASTDATVNSGRYDIASENFINGQTYYVRVRAIIGTQSLTGSWSTDIRNFTVGLEAAPVLNTPEEGATDLATEFTIGIGTVSGASTYDIEISESGDFDDTPPAYQGQLSSASRSFVVSGLSQNTTYTIRWRANNSEYGTTTVTTIAEETSYMNQPNGKYLNTLSTNIPLIQVSGAVNYIWEWDTISTFDSPAFQTQTISASSNNGAYPYSATDFLSGEQYFVRIAVQYSSSTGSYGEIRNIYSSLHTSDISYPSDGEYINRTSLKMKCYNIENATQFEIQYADNSSFSGATTVITNYDWYDPGGWNNPGEGGDLTIRAYNWVSGLDYGTDYYVRARASNANQAGQWGNSIQFNTGGPAVEITQPSNGATGIPTTQYVRCTSAWYVADLYQFQVDDDPGFGSPTSGFSSINGFRFEGLSQNTTYYARVRIKIGSSWAPYSNSSSFTTVSGAKFGDSDEEASVDVEEIIVYPNPSNDLFNVVTPDSEYTINVLNTTGQLIESYSVDGGVIELGRDLPTGIYVLVCQDGDGNVTTKRIVKE